MKDLNRLNLFRVSGRSFWGWDGDGTCGAFSLPSPIDRQPLAVIASTDGAWDHVSVSRKNRAPNWKEMDFIKRAFFEDREVAMQLHVASTDHINCHPNTLHLWRPQKLEIPLPPKEFV